MREALIFCLIFGVFQVSNATSNQIDESLVDKFKTCSIGLSFNKKTKRINGPFLHVKKGSRAIIKNGHASIKIASKYKEIPLKEITMPLVETSWIQYRLLLEASPSFVLKTIEKEWGVHFQFTGSDGMDEKTKESYRLMDSPIFVAIFSTEKVNQTILECNI